MILTGIGRLGRNVELRYLADGTAVANLALCFNYGRKDQAGNIPSQWVEGALFGKQAEAMAQYLLKGGMVSVAIEGPHIEFYTKHDGTQQSKLTGRIINIEFAGSKREGEQAQQKPAPQPAATRDNFDDLPFDDDIPF